MYGLSDTSFLGSLCHLDFPDLTASLPFPSVPNLTPSSSLFTYNQLAVGNVELDSLQESLGLLNSEVSYSGSSGPCSSYGSPTSLASCGTTHATQRPSLMQRSVSSHSLRKNGLSRRLGFRVSGLFDAEGPVRRVYSAGDLQGMNRVYQGRAESPLCSESSIIIEGMTKACRYSPEEKRDRIERYKTKRNQRNFNKKIKYECRKTLADSRRRIRGRFARNQSIDQTDHQKNSSSPVQSWSYAAAADEDGEEDDSWINFLHSSSPNLIS